MTIDDKTPTSASPFPPAGVPAAGQGAAPAVQQFDPRRASPAARADKRDLDSEAAIDELVLRFYYKLLNDPVMAPLFYEVAKIEVGPHIVKIAHYWYKMLLGDKRYRRHTMQIHRNLHGESPLRGIHHERWLMFFVETVDAHFAGPKAEMAKRIASRFIGHLYDQTNGPVRLV